MAQQPALSFPRPPLSVLSFPVEPAKPKNYVIFYDPNRCLGCWNCYLACAVEHSQSKDLFQAIHETPRPMPRLRVLSIPRLALPYVVQCMHCENPPCMNVCPVGAIYKGPDGIVRIDEAACIGCKQCVRACPFGAMLFDHDRGVAIKCDMCEDRLREGLPPACVEACPTGALRFGDLSEIVRGREQEVGKKFYEALRQLIEPRPKAKRASYRDVVPAPSARWY